MELDKICAAIRTADPDALNLLTQCIVRRYGELFAEEEVVFLSLPKHDSAERSRIITAVLRLDEEVKNPE